MNFKKTIVVIIALSILSLVITQTLEAQPQIPESTKMVNINTADIARLCTIPGIGKKMADRVISYRKKHGKFRKTAEIMKVKGIGQKRFNKIRNLLTI